MPESKRSILPDFYRRRWFWLHHDCGCVTVRHHHLSLWQDHQRTSLVVRGRRHSHGSQRKQDQRQHRRNFHGHTRHDRPDRHGRRSQPVGIHVHRTLRRVRLLHHEVHHLHGSNGLRLQRHFRIWPYEHIPC